MERPTPPMPPGEDVEVERSAHSLFAVLDSNVDGRITETELKEGMKRLKIPVHEDDVQRLFAAMDENGDLAVTYEEAKHFVAAQRKMLWKVFCSLDTKSDGKIDVEEVEQSLHALRIPFSSDEVSRLFKRFDRDNNGTISFEEWTDMLLLVPQAHAENLFRFWEEALLKDSGDLEIKVQKRKPRSVKEALTQMMAGAIAGCTSRTMTAPIERLKILYQVSPTKPPGFMAVLRGIYQESGWRGFWRGNGAHCLKVAPEVSTKFVTFETVKRSFADSDADLESWQRAVAGGSAGVTAHVTWFPLEVIKTRLQAAGHGVYNGIADCIRKTVASEGWIRPFYRGLSASIMSTIPHSSIDLATYETLKHAYIRSQGAESVPPGYALFACATISSALGQLAGYPFHLVKSRFIAQGVKGRPKLYKRIRDVFILTWRSEGFFGFYRGITPSFAKAIPSHGVTLVTYELLKRAFGIERGYHSREGKHHGKKEKEKEPHR